MRHATIVRLQTATGETVAVEEQREPSKSYGRPFVTQFTDIIPAVARAIDSAVELKVLLTLPLHLDWTTFRRLNQTELGKTINADRATISRAMIHLHKLGIVERQGRGPVTLWRLSDEWGWKGTVDAYHASRRKRGKLAPRAAGPTAPIAAEGREGNAQPDAKPKAEQRTLPLLTPIKTAETTNPAA